MRRISPSKTKQAGEGKKASWQRRPSEIRGYLTALYMTTDDGDYIRVDFNLREKKVRVYLEDSEEGGNPYYAVIVGERVTSQRNATTGRPVDLAEKLKKRAEALFALPNREVLKIVKKTLELGEPGKAEEKQRTRQEVLKQTKKRYFKPEEFNVSSAGEDSMRPGRRFLIDTVDILAGGTLCAASFAYFNSYLISGALSAAYGVMVGLVDMFVRGVPPSFVKILLFIVAGMALYVYGYYFF